MLLALLPRASRRVAGSCAGAARRGWLALALVLVVCAGCIAGSGDRAWGSQTLALTLDAGQPVLLVYTCAGGEPVASLRITTHDVHSATEEVLWQIQRTSPDRPVSESVERIRMGDTLAGYRSVKELSGPLPAGALDISVTRSRPRGVFTFKVRDLKATALRVDPSWYDGHRSVDESKFLRVNRKNC